MDFIKILLADTTFTFAAEIVLRSVLMYFLIILVLRFSALYTTNFIGPLSYQAFSFLKLLALS